MAITLVTALFDINRRNWPHYGLADDYYLNWMKNTVSLDANLVIYTDNYFIEEVVDLVAHHGHPETTKIVNKNVYSQLSAYKSYGTRLEQLMASEEFKKQIHFPVPEMTQPVYNVLMFNKIPFILDAYREFGGTPDSMYWWLDAGGLREDIRQYKNKPWPSPYKMSQLPRGKCLFFSHHADIKIIDPKEHALSQTRYIQGTAFAGRASDLAWVNELVSRKVHECIHSGYIGSDEKIFDLVYLENPDWFQLEVSGWREYYTRYL